MSKTRTRPLKAIELYVSPHGNDRWSGKRPSANRAGTDGPFVTVERARRAVRALKIRGLLAAPVHVNLRSGIYEQRRPLVFTERDAGTPPETWWSQVQVPAHAVTWRAYRNEKPVISGGKRVSGWKETTVHGRKAWSARLPAVRRGDWFFTQLWVNGRRAARTILPEEGRFRIAELPDALWEGPGHQPLFTGQDRFVFTSGDLEAWSNVGDVEFVGLHYWIDSRINFKRIDVKNRMAHLQWRSRMRLSDDASKTGAPYYVENVYEVLRKAGQWYLDRPTGTLFYLPRRGERIADVEVYAPVLPEVMRIESADSEQPVEYLNFEGITFAHTEWSPADPTAEVTPQAACHVPGAVQLRNARHCRFDDCSVAHVGTYAMELTDGCRDVDVSGCALVDLGGGGIKIWHTFDAAAEAVPGAGADMTHTRSCRRITVSDCEIGDGGYRYHQAVGVLIGKCSGNRLLHNEIHDFDYTGISVGWTWGYAEGHAYGNIIEHNHVHHIGRGMLSDMGGIYTLGVAPGTRIRHNVFHDIEARGYGGWAIYTDEGSSHILIENNLCYRTKHAGFNQHYGRDNIVRNNIFACGRAALISRSRLEAHNAFTFTGNIIYLDNDGSVLAGDWSAGNAVVDRNLYFSSKRGKTLDFAGRTFKQWQRFGMDRQSIVANPRFADPAAGDFALAADSPAAKIGFVLFDFSTVGPRPKRQRR
jgi:hypothetical protein